MFTKLTHSMNGGDYLYPRMKINFLECSTYYRSLYPHLGCFYFRKFYTFLEPLQLRRDSNKSPRPDLIGGSSKPTP